MSDLTPGTGTLPTPASSRLPWLFLSADRRLRVVWRVALLLAGMLLVYALATGVLMVLVAVCLRYEPERPSDLVAFLSQRLPYWPLVVGVVAVPFLVLLVWCFRRFLDRRSWRSLGFEPGPAPLREAGVGLALGGAAILLSIAPLAFSGAVENASARGSGVPGAAGPRHLPIVLGCLVAAAFVEELVARAYILTNVREGLGSVGGVLISAAIFAGLHRWNPDVSTISTVNIFLAGLLLGAVFVLTGRLWMPWMLHVSWNACQGMLLGLPVSGLAIPSLFRLRLVGSDLATGGAFGLEGSLWNTVALGAMLCFVVLVGARRRATDGLGQGGAEGSQGTEFDTQVT
jgi:membrane protease YdiL (CAAX protease family)